MNITLVVVILLLSGMSLLLYPSVSDYLNRVNRTANSSAYVDSVSNISETDYRMYLDRAVAYNEKLASQPAHWRLNDEEMT